MFPEILAKAILAGRFIPRELNQTELANCVTSLPYLFWAQHNAQNKPLVIQGQTSGVVRASCNVPRGAASQEDILETLDALDSFGTQEMGDASDLKTLLVLGRNFLQWSTSDTSTSGSTQVSIEPLPHFAVLNSKNFEPLRKLASQVSSQLGWVTWDRYIDFFATSLSRAFQGETSREVLEVTVDFEASSITQNGPLDAAEPFEQEGQLLSANVLPVLLSNRAPTHLIGPVKLEIETRVEAFATGNVDERGHENNLLELEFKTVIKFLILAEQGFAAPESKFLSILEENFQLAIYFDNSSNNLSWRFLEEVSSPVITSESVDVQIIRFGSQSINLTVRRLDSEEVANNLHGTPWFI
jgi:hypothetical protein